MKQTVIKRPEIKLVGISVRTSYQQELNTMQGKIFPCVQQYFHEEIFEKISNRTKPGTTFCAYTEYDSDYKGAYTYFIGEEVLSFGNAETNGLQKLIIPAQKYMKFTTNPAAMPDVVVNTWKKIWKMTSTELGGERCYDTDFEIYDERALDHENIILDVFVGIQ